jgi:hypothetical protein
LFHNLTGKEQRQERRKNTEDVTEGVEVAGKKGRNMEEIAR